MAGLTFAKGTTSAQKSSVNNNTVSNLKPTMLASSNAQAGLTYPDGQQTFSLIPGINSTSRNKSSSTGSSAYGASGGGASAQDLAQYDQAIGNINAGISRLDSTLNSGYSGIDASYQNALNQLLLSKNQGEGVYNTNKKQTATDYVGAKNTIGSKAGNLLKGLQRLLGSRGAGGGSAYRISAPNEVARDATIQRGDAKNTFGANNQSLDNNWGNFMVGYNNEVSGANNQRDIQRQELASSVGNNRATLLQQLAGLQAQRAQASGGNGVTASQDSINQANSILDNLANYSIKPIAYQTQAYQAPTLDSYATDQGARATFQGQPSENDYTSPYLASLLGKRKQLA